MHQSSHLPPPSSPPPYAELNANPQIQSLYQAHLKGKISRRDFVVQAGAVFAGLAATINLTASVPRAVAALATATPLALATPSSTPEADDPITSTVLTVPVGTGAPTPAYLSRPQKNGKFPAVVVIQEWWGLDAHIKSIVDRLARNGFIAIAPDLYRGEVATEPNEARKLAMGLVQTQALADIQGAADYLTALPDVEPKQVGVWGFCMGGGLAMRMAWEGQTNIGAVVSFYGGGTQIGAEEAARVKVPILGIYGENDGGIPVTSIRAWEGILKQAGKTNEMVVYEGAGHGFFNDTRPAYAETAAADAFRRTLNWFRTYLIATS